VLHLYTAPAVANCTLANVAAYLPVQSCDRSLPHVCVRFVELQSLETHSPHLMKAGWQVLPRTIVHARRRAYLGVNRRHALLKSMLEWFPVSVSQFELSVVSLNQRSREYSNRLREVLHCLNQNDGNASGHPLLTSNQLTEGGVQLSIVC
jgi:hypothetical protein